MLQSKLVKVTFLIVIFTFLIIGAFFNANFGFSIGSKSVDFCSFDCGGFAVGAASIVADLAKALLWAAIPVAILNKKYGSAFLAIVGALIASSWSIVSSVGFTAHAQHVSSKAAARSSPSHIVASAKYADALSMIRARPSMQTATIVAKISEIKAIPYPKNKKKSVGEYLECDATGSKFGAVSRKYCPKISRLKAMLAAHRVADLAIISVDKAKVNLDKAEEKADTQTAAIVSMASLIGIRLRRGKVRASIKIIWLAVLEVLQPILSLIYGSFYGPKSRACHANQSSDFTRINHPINRDLTGARQMAQTCPFDGQVDRHSGGHVDGHQSQSIVPPNRAILDAQERLTNWVIDMSVDGRLTAPLGDIAAAIGASRNTAKKHLKSLKGQGKIDYKSSNKGFLISVEF